ncbi:hypothetical protein AcV7_004764 [Taiwanofungus camphoratus]|nr:hypothetical protein AcV7_004764 [Antrodia cinnamomea]
MTNTLVVALAMSLVVVQDVSAHGYVNGIVIDGETVYPGNAPGHYTIASPIRMVSNNGPVQNISDLDLACGRGAQSAQLDAQVAPGSVVSFAWVSGAGGNWEHETGPILTYMALCGSSTTCADFNASGAQWFKIDQVGKKNDDAGWVQEDIMNGAPINVTIPSDLAAGSYLIRNEIISLQNAMAPGGAEFFPSCTQLQIIGSGTGSSTSTVHFPGAYNASDPGILVDVYTDPHAVYVFPGPPIATLVDAATEMNWASLPAFPTEDARQSDPISDTSAGDDKWDSTSAIEPVLPRHLYHSRVMGRVHSNPHAGLALFG